MELSIEQLKIKFMELLDSISDKVNTKLGRNETAVAAQRLSGEPNILLSGDVNASTIPFYGDQDVTLDIELKNVVTAGTGAKLTYDAKGRVTGATLLVANDIPELPQSKITGLTDALAAAGQSTRLRGGSGSVYLNGDITLVAGQGISITQNGSEITIALTESYLPLTGGVVTGDITVNGEVFADNYLYNT